MRYTLCAQKALCGAGKRLGGPVATGQAESDRGVMSDYTSQPISSGAATRQDEARLIAELRRGDEAAFMRLVEQYQMALVRLAQVYVDDLAVAQEVTQEAWLSVLKHLDQFEARSSFKTWLFRILVNGARARSQRERRSVPFSALGEAADEPADDESAVAAERFYPADGRYPGGWVAFPQSWALVPEARVESEETRACLLAAIERLPVNQRSVIRLRDVEGYSADEVCDMLGISAANQRVLLHRARSRVRQALEAYFTEV